LLHVKQTWELVGQNKITTTNKQLPKQRCFGMSTSNESKGTVCNVTTKTMDDSKGKGTMKMTSDDGDRTIKATIVANMIRLIVAQKDTQIAELQKEVQQLKHQIANPEFRPPSPNYDGGF
jgi:hypothetical protein